MYNLLSLKGKNISLLNVEERNIKGRDYSLYLSKIRFKNIHNIHIKLLIKSNDTGQIIGYILSYNYNRTDGHVRIDCDIHLKYMNEYTNEVLSLFCNYLYTCFPIRKIYFEIFNNFESNIIELLEKVGFEQEACLKEDTFYNNKYYDKYVFTLDVNNFFGVNTNGK